MENTVVSILILFLGYVALLLPVVIKTVPQNRNTQRVMLGRMNKYNCLAKDSQ